MAFFFAYDRKPFREEELAYSRVASRHPARQVLGPNTSTPTDTPISSADRRAEYSTAPYASPTPSPTPKRRNIVLPDHVAYKYLEEDPAVRVVEPRSILHGYELYLVEQWACSRQSPTFVIASYTGDQRHSIVVGVLGVPADESAWSSRLRVFFKAIHQHHARPKETHLGELLVTNLSSFPSALTVITVPDGDIRTHQKSFMVNEDLKRMGCSGRSGLTLTAPTPATQAKFYQLYKVSESLPLYQAVLELVKLCQVALYIFGNLDQEYMDGLLCDVTETAIRDWWTEIGTDYYNMEPSDGILGPTTVAALLGTLGGARNRLHSYGVTAPKDVFDIDGMRRAISSFQKYQKYERTGRLDRQTLLRLQSVTAKAAAAEGWTVPKAVKSTMAEIGGKRGEIVMGIVSGRDKAGISDIETADIDKFIALVGGERAKWLWHGKPRRTGAEGSIGRDDMSGMLAKEDTTLSRQSYPFATEDDLERFRKEDSPAVAQAYTPAGHSGNVTDSPGDRDNIGKAVFKTVAGKMSDARSGLGRIKDAVGGGRKTHSSRPSMARDDFADAGLLIPGPVASPPFGAPPRAFTWKNKPEEYADAFQKRGENGSVQYDPSVAQYQGSTPPQGVSGTEDGNGNSPAGESENIGDVVRREIVDGHVSTVVSVAGESDLLGPLFQAERCTGQPLRHLRRRHSIELARPSLRCIRNENRWARRVSFGDAEEAVLRWEELLDISDLEDATDHANSSTAPRPTHLEELARVLGQKIQDIEREIGPWAAQSVQAVGQLDHRFAHHQEELRSLASQLAEAHRNVRASAAEIVAEERGDLGERVKEVDALLARLEYEMNSLAGKVEDVEDGVLAYERQVEDVERRAEELRAQLEKESWVHWFVRTLTGIGTGPNITRPRVVAAPKR